MPGLHGCKAVGGGLVGIPAFVKEDGTVTFKAEEVGLAGAPAAYETE